MRPSPPSRRCTASSGTPRGRLPVRPEWPVGIREGRPGAGSALARPCGPPPRLGARDEAVGSRVPGLRAVLARMGPVASLRMAAGRLEGTRYPGCVRDRAPGPDACPPGPRRGLGGRVAMDVLLCRELLVHPVGRSRRRDPGFPGSRDRRPGSGILALALAGLIVTERAGVARPRSPAGPFSSSSSPSRSSGWCLASTSGTTTSSRCFRWCPARLRPGRGRGGSNAGPRGAAITVVALLAATALAVVAHRELLFAWSLLAGPISGRGLRSESLPESIEVAQVHP